jgi:hypothetical protein
MKPKKVTKQPRAKAKGTKDPVKPVETLDDIEGKGRVRSDLRLFTRAIREGWTVDPMFKRAAIQRTAQVLADATANRRDVARATTTLMAIDRLSLDAAMEEDRMSRLDAGEVTDRVQVMSDLTDDQLTALAKTIRNDKR